MTFSKSFIGLLLLGGLNHASSLAVYQDKTLYRYVPSSNFIGFSQGVTAQCEGNTLDIVALDSCPEERRLCKNIESLKESKQALMAVDASMKVLTKFLSLPQPTIIDTSSWIASAKQIGEEQAALFMKKETLGKQYKHLELAFQKQAPSLEAKVSAKSCEKELLLHIPYGYVSFKTAYEANIINDEVAVTQKLSILNRSGIDIHADKATFYYRSVGQYVQPMHFSPWIVRKYVPEKRMYKKSTVGAVPKMAYSMEAEGGRGGDLAMVEPVVAQYQDAREYSIDDLTLPSTGVALDVNVLSWKAALDCKIKAYPYRNTKAFEVCTFTPKYQIDSNGWKVISGSEVVNEHAVGEYRKGIYHLYTKIVDDIQIRRRPIVKKERQTGIFGGTARKQDGFTLTITNKSNKIKTLTLIERIPTSTTTEIKSKLLSVESVQKVKYTMLKDGEIEMHLTLGANQTQKIDVLFEISYDKDVKVRY